MFLTKALTFVGAFFMFTVLILNKRGTNYGKH